jgi:hypothetical protein
MSEKKASTFPAFLGLIVAVFIGIMLYVYQEAKRANPVILDEKGNVR